MGVLDRGSDRRRGRGSFGGEFGASHRCIAVREQYALFTNYSGEDLLLKAIGYLNKQR